MKSEIRPQGQFFWDDFINKVRPRYEVIVTDPYGWEEYLDTGHDIRGWYEEAVADAMANFSGHPIKPLTELEAFIGTILNKSGVQNHRQRDSSIKLRAEFDRISTWIMGEMRRVRHDPDVLEPTGPHSGFHGLHLCLACVHAGCDDLAGQRESRQENLQSFKVVAACALLEELGRIESGRGGGGYVGVR